MIKCPICGYSEQQLNKQPSNVMNMYVNKNDPKDICAMNSADKEVKHADGKVYVKVDSQKAFQDLIKPQEIDPETIKAPELKKEDKKGGDQNIAPSKPQIEKAPIIQSEAPIAATAPPVTLKPAQP